MGMANPFQLIFGEVLAPQTQAFLQAVHQQLLEEPSAPAFRLVVQLVLAAPMQEPQVLEPHLEQPALQLQVSAQALAERAAVEPPLVERQVLVPPVFAELPPLLLFSDVSPEAPRMEQLV